MDELVNIFWIGPAQLNFMIFLTNHVASVVPILHVEGGYTGLHYSFTKWQET